MPPEARSGRQSYEGGRSYFGCEGGGFRAAVRWLLIFVALPDGQRIQLNATASETIGNIKARLRSVILLTGLAPHDFELLRPGLGLLRDGATLSDCNIQSGDVIHAYES